MNGRRERMQIGELWPDGRHYLDNGIELHGAGIERDHGAIKPKIFVGQPAQEAHLVGL